MSFMVNGKLSLSLLCREIKPWIFRGCRVLASTKMMACWPLAVLIVWTCCWLVVCVLLNSLPLLKSAHCASSQLHTLSVLRVHYKMYSSCFMLLPPSPPWITSAHTAPNCAHQASSSSSIGWPASSYWKSCDYVTVRDCAANKKKRRKKKKEKTTFINKHWKLNVRRALR